MPAVCFYFQVHQPYRLRHFTIFDIGKGEAPDYFDAEKNAAIVQRVAAKCYLPVNRVLLRDVHRHEGQFRVAFSVTGTALDQLAEYAPHVLESFDQLAATGAVEFLGETDNHSLSALYSWDEFDISVGAHRERIRQLSGRDPTVFRNTELIYSDALAQRVEAAGYAGVLADGVPRVLQGRSPGQAYRPAGCKTLTTLTKNAQLSDDIAFRFSAQDWKEWPLTAPKFAAWVRALEGSADTVNLFLDYETFGEHHWAASGILEFLSALPEEILRYPENHFATPSDLVRDLTPRDELRCPEWTSWADVDRDLSAWLGNHLQEDAVHAVYELRDPVLATGDAALIRTWRRLLTSDHFYYMSLKAFGDGEVHRYFSPYRSPYDAYIYFMNVVSDLRWRLGLDRKVGARRRSGGQRGPASQKGQPASPASPASPA